MKKENTQSSTAEFISQVSDFHHPLLGENVYIFSPEDDPSLVQATLAHIHMTQESAQFGDHRYAYFFLPGKYDDSIFVEVDFYTQVAGLGVLPTDVSIGGLNCLGRWLGDPDNHKGTCNFWRSVENIEIRSDVVWAVSQATDMRRVKVDGTIALHDEHGWVSGGFMSNSVVTEAIDSGTQQQWLSRNNSYLTWIDDNWNMVFLGDEQKQPVTSTWPDMSYTTVERTPIVREKPFLYLDKAEGLKVYVPGFKTNSKGACWIDEADRSLDIDKFYIAKADWDTASSINEALASGKNIIFTPGIYMIDEPIVVKNPDTILLGLGLATLSASNGNACMTTASVPGIIIAGLLFDAGEKESDNLLIVGSTPVNNSVLRPQLENNPILLSDVYFRVGGLKTASPTRARCCITVNTDYTIGDNLWIWRADHGDQVAWDKNTCANGIIINGNHVKMYALMVEHFQEYQTIWNGEDGVLIMYQSEIPYDVPSQEVWMSREGMRPGYSSIYVDDRVKSFDGTGIGIYLFNRDTEVRLESAIEMPKTEHTHLHNVITVLLTGHPGMAHIVNDEGDAVMKKSDTAIMIDF